MRTQLCILALVVVAAVYSACKKHEPDSPAPEPTGKYFPQVKIIVQNHCTISCHAPSKGLGNGQPVILETDSDISMRAQAIKASVADPVTYANKRMPAGPPLSASQVDVIVQWAARGGKITD